MYKFINIFVLLIIVKWFFEMLGKEINILGKIV